MAVLVGLEAGIDRRIGRTRVKEGEELRTGPRCCQTSAQAGSHTN